jgi:hypothetical protein
MGSEGYRQFWRVLESLCEGDSLCPGCHASDGPPLCEIRQCARERGIEVCAFCESYPCERIREIETEGHVPVEPAGPQAPP